MDIKETRRKLFESTTILPAGVVWNSETKSYEGPNYWLAEYAWSALNRALDSIVIELPQDPNEEFCDRRSAIAACYEAIENTGLGIEITW